MARTFTPGDLADEALLAVGTLAGRAADLISPSLRLGVTGLSQAGKTVFISALVHNLIHGGRLPLFKPYAAGQVSSAALRPQPDDAVPRFAYEDHIRALVEDRIWPQSTSRVSQLRLTIRYESARFLSRRFGRGELNLDIVDYPGEWLLDLSLIGKDYATWSREAIALARAQSRERPAAPFLEQLAAIDPTAPEDETTARRLASLFTDYLRAAHDDPGSIALLPPGRFLLPGDLAGSPALTFAPLDRTDGTASVGSLHAMMARRFESYKAAVVKPFFRDHFARLDRQIVLVDTLQALNAGPGALAELEQALTDILAAFRPGRGSWLSTLLVHRIDRILFAATKADHLHHGDHDRLEAILERLLKRAIERASFAGAELEVLAIAAVRATREATVLHGRDRLPTIVGTPVADETVDGKRFDGKTEIALFPGDLPEDPESIFAAPAAGSKDNQPAVRFVSFRPPPLERTDAGIALSLPHIRLDRALQFLIGDRLA